MTNKTAFTPMTPDFSPVVKLMAMQTRFAIESGQGMMKLAMMPWAGMQGVMPAIGTIYAPFGTAAVAVAVDTVEQTEKAFEASAPEAVVEAAPEAADPVPEAAAEAEVIEAVEETVVAEPAVEAEPVVEAAEAGPAAPEEAPVAEAVAETVEDTGPVMPEKLDAPKGSADDLTVLKGLGPKMARNLNAAGIYHLDQVAKWTDQNIAWIDENVTGVRGRAVKNGWVAQAAEMIK